MEIKDIKRFIDLIEDTDITELHWEKDGVKIGFKKGLPLEITDVKKGYSKEKKTQEFSESISGVTKESIKKETEEKLNNLFRIKAPIVGTFYRAATPDMPFYVEEGNIIDKGRRLCVIEAMKVMKEINSEVSGKIVKILVKNGENVEYGQDLFLVDTKVKKS